MLRRLLICREGGGTGLLHVGAVVVHDSDSSAAVLPVQILVNVLFALECERVLEVEGGNWRTWESAVNCRYAFHRPSQLPKNRDTKK